MKNRRKHHSPHNAAFWLWLLRGPLIYLCTFMLLSSCWFATQSMAAESPVNLDLSSTTASVSASEAISTPVNIQVGDTSRSVTGSSILTPAEYIAAVQVANNQPQSIILSSAGNAIGGSFLTNTISVPLSGLVVPTGVTAVGDFGHTNSLSITGNLVNAGSFYALSSVQGASASISAANITNQQGAQLSSILPTLATFNFGNLFSVLNFNLSASNNIINNGSISSAGALALTAGNQILNSTISGAATASIQAANALSMTASSIVNQAQIASTLSNLNISTNTLTNAGLLQSIAGSVNIQSLTGHALNVMNTSGTISALNALNFTTPGNSAANLLQVLGGTLNAHDISLTARAGSINVNVIDIGQNVAVNTDALNLSVSNGTHGLILNGIHPQVDSGSLLYHGIGNVSFQGFSTAGGSIDVDTSNGSIVVLGPGNSGKPGDINTLATSGASGSVVLRAGSNISVGDIVTAANASASAGDITLVAGHNVAAGSLDASALAGLAGDITVQSGVAGTGDITTGSISTYSNNAGGTVVLTTPGVLTINGDLTAPAGTVSLTSGTTNITGTLNVDQGQVHIEHGGSGPYLVNFSDLLRFGGSDISIGSSTMSSDIVLSGNCNQCLAGLTSLSLTTAGRYIASGTTLVLTPDTDLLVAAGSGIFTGTVSGGKSISFSTAATLTVDGNISANGAVNLRGDTSATGNLVNLAQGTTINGTTVSVSSGAGNITSGANIVANAGDISFNSGGRLNLLDGGVLTAKQDISLAARQDITLGSANGVGLTLSAGSFNQNQPVNNQLLAAGSISSSGSVLIDNYAGGLGNGNITLGSNITLTGHGSNLASGDVGLRSAVDIQIGTGANLTSYGGNIWLNAANDINVGAGAQFISAGALNNSQDSTGTVFATLPAYSGGAIAIMSGAPNSDMAAFLQNLSASRTGAESVTVPNSQFASNNSITTSGGSILNVVFPGNGGKTVTGNTFNLIGGTVFLDPPGTNNVTITGANFVAVGPQLVAIPPVPGAGGGNAGGVGTGAGGTVGTTPGGTSATPTGSPTGVLNSLTTSTANSSALSVSTTTALTGSSTSSVDQLNGSVSTTVNGTSANVPSDSTRGDNAKATMRTAVYCSPLTLLDSSGKSNDDSWIMASSKCQPYAFEQADGSIIIGNGPAIFAPSTNRTLLLKDGKLLVIAGEAIIVVRTPMCNITIPINSAATIEYKPEGLTRLTTLAGGRANISVTRQGETIILSAAPGEQLVLAESSVPDSEIRCEPFVASKQLDSWLVQLAGIRGHKFTFDRGEMVSREELLNCTLGCFTKLQQSMIEQIRKSMVNESPKELKSLLPAQHRLLIAKGNGNNGNTKTNHLAAVGFGSLANLTLPTINTISCKSALLKSGPEASFAIERSDTINLKKGDMLVCASSPTTINAGKYVVKVQPGTIALVSNRADHVIVRNVCQGQSTGTNIITPDKKHLGVQVGQETIVGHAGISFTRVLGEDAVGRRRMRHIDMGADSNIIASEVSLVSLIQNMDILSQLSRSQLADDKALMARVMKMAVALQMITQSHGNYSMSGQ